MNKFKKKKKKTKGKKTLYWLLWVFLYLQNWVRAVIHCKCWNAKQTAAAVLLNRES